MSTIRRPARQVHLPFRLLQCSILFVALQVAALESLSKALFVEVLELRKEHERAISSRTLWGHCKNLAGYCLSAYCLFK